jgi:hypothetical protein
MRKEISGKRKNSDIGKKTSLTFNSFTKHDRKTFSLLTAITVMYAAISILRYIQNSKIKKTRINPVLSQLRRAAMKLP